MGSSAIVPTRTPMFDGMGDPNSGPSTVAALGTLTRTWQLFFGALASVPGFGLHADRATLSPGGVPSGQLFVETDRGAIYQARMVAQSPAWVLVVSWMAGLLVNRPVDLTPNDAGFIYYATDDQQYWWTGIAWSQIGTGSGAGGAAAVQTSQTLTAATTVASPGTPVNGALWIARYDQDSVGGWAITWPVDIPLAPQVLATVNSAPLTMCIITFVGIGGKWYACADPILAAPIV